MNSVHRKYFNPSTHYHNIINMQLLAAQRVRTASLGRQLNLINRAMRRNLSLWHPPKFENEKPVRYFNLGVRNSCELTIKIS